MEKLNKNTPKYSQLYLLNASQWGGFENTALEHKMFFDLSKKS